MEATGSAFLILAAVSMVAAIVGGNVSLPGGATFGAIGSRTIRALLGSFSVVLFVVGVVLFLVAGTSSTPDSGPTPPTTTSPSSSSSGTTEVPTSGAPVDLADQVNPICDEAGQRLAAIEQPADDAGYEQYADYFQQNLVVFDNQLSQLRSLAGGSSSSGFEEYLTALGTYVEELENFLDGLRRQDDAALEVADASRDDAIDELNASAREQGFAACIIR